MAISCILYRFLLRCMVVAAVFKSGLEIALFPRETPRQIVQRSHLLLGKLQGFVHIDQDPVMRFVMLHQVRISQVYGALTVLLCVLIALNVKRAAKPLIALILSSVVFFYVDFRAGSSLIPESHLTSVQTLVTIIGGLFLIDGYDTIEAPKVVARKPKVEAPAKQAHKVPRTEEAKRVEAPKKKKEPRPEESKVDSGSRKQ